MNSSGLLMAPYVPPNPYPFCSNAIPVSLSRLLATVATGLPMYYVRWGR